MKKRSLSSHDRSTEFHHLKKKSTEFHGYSDVSRLAELMIETRKDRTFPLVYRLIELTLILPVATASVERKFSAMSII
jgi:hypothetical protein